MVLSFFAWFAVSTVVYIATHEAVYLLTGRPDDFPVQQLAFVLSCMSVVGVTICWVLT